MFAEKRVVVTGAASGIGLAIAQAFAREGAEVFFLDLREEAAQSAASDCASKHEASCTGIGVDIADSDAVQSAFEQIGALDILVNSAGVAHIGTVLDTTTEDFDRLFRVNVRGSFLCMQAALRHMVSSQSGVVLNVASIAATSGLRERFAYSMSKGAVLAMTLSAAKDCLASGIRINCISPARVHTPFVDGFLAANYPGKEGEMMQTLAAAQPIGRMGTPDEIAKLALYLCSDSASFITGTDVLIDGGFTNLR